MAEKRAKRACVTRKALVPSAVHYVGYVEEGETPEMIMKKFEELDRILAQQKAAAGSTEGAAGASSAGDADSEAEAMDGGAGVLPSYAGTSGAQLSRVDHGTPDNEQLLQIFKATSIFNVRSAMANNEVLMAGDHNADRAGGTCVWSDGELCSDEDDELDQLRGFWSDDEQWDIAKGRKGRRPRQQAGERASKAARTSGQGAASKARTAVVTQYNRDTNAFIRRRVRVLDPDAIVQLRIPDPPLPLSWGRRVQPFVQTAAPGSSDAAAASAGAAAGTSDSGGVHGTEGAAQQRAGAQAEATSSSCLTVPDLCEFDFSNLPQREFLALLINTGWRVEEGEDAQPGSRDGGATAAPSHQQQKPTKQRRGSSGAASCAPLTDAATARLARLPIPQLCPKGFVFIWAPKQLIAGIMRQMYAWNYTYVENLTWVLMHPNNSILRLPSPYAKASHITLLIFRREGEGRDIELRHQRSPDVIFDCMTAAPGCEWAVPSEVYRTIETMLPTGMGSFLELWAATGSARIGWKHVAESLG